MSRIHLTKRTRLWINCVGSGVWATGAGWLIAHYFVKPQDAFGLHSSSEPWWLKAHGAFALLATWTGGLLWSMHVVKAWTRGLHRWSGGTLFGSLLLLIVSGYLLYYVGNDRARGIVSLTHWILGLAIPLAYLTHRIAKRIVRPRLRRQGDPLPPM
jgi:hypothetical protein